MQKRANRLWIFSLVLLFYITGFSISIAKADTKSKNKVNDNLTLVTVEPLKYHILPQTITGYGNVISPQSVALRSQINGSIQAIKFKYGQKVKSGDILFVIKNTAISEQLKGLAADLKYKKQNYLRLNQQAKLFRSSVSEGGENGLIKAQTDYQQSLSKYNQAYNSQNLLSPISGIVSATNLAVGDYVSAGDSLVKVTKSVNKKSLQIQYILPSSYINKAKVGQSVEFTPAQSQYDKTNQVYKASVSYVSPEVNPDTQGVFIRADFLENINLAPNTFGQVTQVINPKYRTLAIPQGLVQTDPAGFFVFAYHNNKVVKEYFTPGVLTKSGLIEVVSGLKDKEQIITTNPEQLSPGEKVKLS
jgi:membrane fusion protein, multidrug efflux system